MMLESLVIKTNSYYFHYDNELLGGISIISAYK